MSTVATATTIPTALATKARRRARVLTVALTMLAALALWVIVEYGFGLDLRSPAFGAGGSADIGAVNVLIAALIGSAAGWALLAVLERFTARARKLWTAGAIVALLVSLGGPFGGTGITASNRLVLALMHVVVAGVVIAGLYRSSARAVDAA